MPFFRLAATLSRMRSAVCEPNRNYQIEDAGAHADGTPLLAIYVAEPAPDVREAA